MPVVVGAGYTDEVDDVEDVGDLNDVDDVEDAADLNDVDDVEDADDCNDVDDDDAICLGEEMLEAIIELCTANEVIVPMGGGELVETEGIIVLGLPVLELELEDGVVVGYMGIDSGLVDVVVVCEDTVEIGPVLDCGINVVGEEVDGIVTFSVGTTLTSVAKQPVGGSPLKTI